MSIELNSARNKRLERINECMILTGTSREDMVALGFSLAQVRGWFAKSGSSKASSPTKEQSIKMWQAFDWSPTYIVFGAGSRLISEAGLLGNLYERMNRFEGVLQLALDESEVNKKRYRGALKTIEDRNEQLFSNKQTLADFGVSLAAADKNVSSLSEDVRALSAQLAKVLKLQ